MKKIFLLVLLSISILVTGCGKYGENDIVKDIDKKIVIAIFFCWIFIDIY